MSAPRILVLAAVAVSLGVLLGTCTPDRGTATAVPGAAPLGDASPGIDALVSRFLAALAAGDRKALDRLRVTEAEYREVIIPGSVEPGQPPQRLSDEASRYFWETLDTKSAYVREDLLQRFGGRRWTAMDIRFEKGSKRFANHVAHRRLVLVARDERGEEAEIRTGSIVDVGGSFKFVSFIRD